MKIRTLTVLVIACSLILSACQSTPQATALAPSEAPIKAEVAAPTNTLVPSETPLPTDTPVPTQTPLPENVLFRDDFNGPLQTGWEWENENPQMWGFTGDGWLRIKGESDSLLGQNYQNNLLWYPLPEGNFIVTVHLSTHPSQNFHQAAIFIYEDPKNYVTINRGYCDVCGTGGNGFYMDYKIGRDWGDYQAKTQANDVYLRLESNDMTITGYYATEPDQWQRLGRVGNYFQFKKVGIGVSNLGAGNMVVGLYDYFEISRP
jgi:regulation of enolase protein 1 (concanavalin A-like superfamily)